MVAQALLVFVVIVGSHKIFLADNLVEATIARKERNALTTNTVLVRSFTPLLALGDHKQIQRVMNLMQVYDDLLVARVWLDGELPVAQLERMVGYPLRKPISGLTKAKVERQSNYFFIETPLLSAKGKLGTLQLYISYDKEYKAITRYFSSTKALQASLLILTLLAIYLGVRKYVVSPFKKLMTKMEQLQQGKALPIFSLKNDEVGVMIHSFDQMARAVSERQRRVEEKARELRRVLDNLGEGYILLDSQGNVSGDSSRAVDGWVGPPQEGQAFWQYIENFDRRRADWFESTWDSLGDGWLSPDIVIEQLPTRISDGDLHLDLDFRLLLSSEEEIDGVVVILRDVTAQVVEGRNQQTRSQTIHLFQLLLKDRVAFRSFYSEGQRLVQEVTRDAQRSQEEISRGLHTLKGLCGSHGLRQLAEFCHSLEDRLLANGRLLEADRDTLVKEWFEIVSPVSVHMGKSERLMVRKRDFDRLIGELSNRGQEDLIAEISAWQKVSTADSFERLASHAYTLAKRRGCERLMVEVEHNGVRLPAEDYDSLWAALQHVVTNAVDHGLVLSTTPERLSLRAAKLSFSSEIVDGQVVIEISDNGRGIDFDRLAQLAKAGGLALAPGAPVSDLLFLDGLSSAPTVTATSGRGVGLAAVKEEVERLGGHIKVTSELGHGTSFRVILPSHLGLPCQDKAA